MAQAHIWMDTRAQKQDGRCPLKIVVSHKCKSVILPADLDLHPADWDAKKRRVINLPNRNTLNSYLSRRVIQMEDMLRQLILDGKMVGITARKLKAYLTEEPDRQEGNLQRYFQEFMGRKADGTRKTYKVTLQWMQAFEPHLEELAFEDIDRKWIERFDSYMKEQGIATNTRNLYLHNLRAVFNSALDDERTTWYPFRKVKLKKEETRHRNIPADELRQILNTQIADHRYKQERQMYIDAFRLMFFLIGINAADLCSLRPDDYAGGRIMYRRHKTGRLYDIKVEPEAAEIIERYRGKELLLNFCENRSVARFNVHMNTSLKNIAPYLSTYYARHSWATIAANELDIPKETIARALGHSMRSVTDIYINFDNRKVDDANRRVIDLVLYGRK